MLKRAFVLAGALAIAVGSGSAPHAQGCAANPIDRPNTAATKVTAGTLTTMTLNGRPVAFTRQIIKGVEYAIFTVAAGTYQATYAP
jgi:hypothetical protein